MDNFTEIASPSKSEIKESIIEQLRDIRDLPTLPNVFLNLIRLMRTPETPMKEIANVIETDPATSMKILRLINSAFYGLSRKVDSIHQSVVLLGNKALRNIVASISIFKAMEGGSEKTNFDRKAFWQHSIGCGVFTQYLANRLSTGYNEEGFTSGIIHDIGKIVLDRYFPEEFAAVTQEVRDQKVSFYQAEQQILSTTHPEIGAFLAEFWNLPPKLVEVIAQHHAFDPDSESAQLTAIVQIADMLTHRFQIGSGGDDLIPEVEPLAWQILHTTQEELESWSEEMQAELEKSQELQEMLLEQ